MNEQNIGVMGRDRTGRGPQRIAGWPDRLIPDTSARRPGSSRDPGGFGRSLRFESGLHVLLVDPLPDRRRNLAGRLRRLGAKSVTETTAPRGVQTMAPAAKQCDLVVLRATETPRSTAELVGDLRRQGGKRVVVIAAEHDPMSAIAAFSANAVGYLVESFDPELVDDFEPQPSPSGGLPIRNECGEQVEGLSARESEILSLVADGKTNREIGADLALSANTVKGHLAHMSRRLQTGDRSRMVLLALRSGAIS
ncbi:LuxR C-terminal-related transcriptional regulator [Amycolatopsis speibonae]|uniref:LuxR C-terminal-related transcriptional regulator n=1 Tax=Amycolatopsis speibonae TaxID=1450224 RepID=A0ABV7PDI4_9PSEU